MVDLAAAMCHSLPLQDHSRCAPDLYPWSDPGAWQISEAAAVALALELLRRAGDPTGAVRLATEAGYRHGIEVGWRMCLDTLEVSSRQSGENASKLRVGTSGVLQDTLAQ